MRRHTISRQPERVLEISEEETKLDLSKPEEKEDENDEKDQLLLTNHNIQQSYKNKYKNFICSPRSHFIYETVNFN